jgi:hypothetical protein
MFKGKAQRARFQCMPKDEHTRTPLQRLIDVHRLRSPRLEFDRSWYSALGWRSRYFVRARDPGPSDDAVRSAISALSSAPARMI